MFFFSSVLIPSLPVSSYWSLSVLIFAAIFDTNDELLLPMSYLRRITSSNGPFSRHSEAFVPLVKLPLWPTPSSKDNHSCGDIRPKNTRLLCGPSHDIFVQDRRKEDILVHGRELLSVSSSQMLISDLLLCFEYLYMSVI